MSIRLSDVLFYGGGECLEKFGTLSWRTSIREDNAETFARADTATYVDKGGVVRSAASGEPRVTWLDLDGDGVREPYLLLEGASENLFTQSEDLTHADWTATRLTSRTADQATGPDGVASLDELVEDTGTGQHFVAQTKTITADAVASISAWVMAGSRDYAHLQISEVADGGNRVRAHFDLSAGTVGAAAAAGTGTYVDATIEDFTDVAAGLYRITLTGSVGNGATSVLGLVGLAESTSSASYTGDGASSIHAGFAQFEEAYAASSYVPTTTAADTRAADSFYFPWPFVPVAMTLYAKFVERGTVEVADGAVRLLHIGDGTASTDPRMTVIAIDSSGKRYRASHDNGTATVASDADADSVSVGDVVELRIVLAADGSVLVGQSINAGAETLGSESAANALQAAWAGSRLYVNSHGTGAAGLNAFRSLKIVRGVASLADLRALFS